MLKQVSTPELAEVFAINALAPFILNSKLKPLMMATNPDGNKFIVNVSAMEGTYAGAMAGVAPSGPHGHCVAQASSTATSRRLTRTPTWRRRRST